MSDTPKNDSPTHDTPAKAPSSSAGQPGEGKGETDTPASARALAAQNRERKRGGQSGNRNSLRHGLKAGKLPADCAYIEIRLNGFRRQLEDAVIEAKGEISLSDAAFVQTALRWERHAALAQRWLTKQHDELKPTDRLAFSREIAKASAERDKAISALELNAKDDKPFWSEAFTTGQESDQ